MQIELATKEGEVVLEGTDLDRPAPGDLFQVGGKEWAVTSDPPKSRREEVPPGAVRARTGWVARFTVAEASTVAAILQTDPAQAA